MEEVDEHVFLFGGKRGANVHHFAFGAAGVYEDLLGRKLFGGDNYNDVFTALDLALVYLYALH